MNGGLHDDAWHRAVASGQVRVKRRNALAFECMAVMSYFRKSSAMRSSGSASLRIVRLADLTMAGGISSGLFAVAFQLLRPRPGRFIVPYVTGGLTMSGGSSSGIRGTPQPQGRNVGPRTFIHPSACLSVCQSVCVCVCARARVRVRVCVICLPVSVCLLACLFVCLLFVYLSVCLSVCLSVTDRVSSSSTCHCPPPPFPSSSQHSGNVARELMLMAHTSCL